MHIALAQSCGFFFAVMTSDVSYDPQTLHRIYLLTLHYIWKDLFTSAIAIVIFYVGRKLS